MIKISRHDYKITINNKKIQQKGVIFFEKHNFFWKDYLLLIISILISIMICALVAISGLSFVNKLIVYIICGLTCLLLFWKNKKRGGLFINGQGIGYKDRYYHMLIPWSALSSVLLNKDTIEFQLLTDQKGLGFIVTKAPLYETTESQDPPLLLGEQMFNLQRTLIADLDDIIALIQNYHKFYQTEIEQHLGNKNKKDFAIIFEKIDFENQTVTIKRNVGIAFPPFCPLYDTSCDTTFIRKFGDFTINWLVSYKGIAWRKFLSSMRIGIVVASLLAFWTYTVYLCFYQELPFGTFMRYTTAGLAIFILIPICWYYAREPLEITNSTATTFTVYFKDEDYFRAFVDMNTMPSRQLPWREIIEE